jgi:carnitine 3-dehydrogenase
MQQHDITTIAVLGSGLIGSGWATKFAMSGRAVTLYDISAERLRKANEEIAGNFRRLHRKEVITASEVKKAAGLIRTTMDLKEALNGASLLQENITENLKAKQTLLAGIERYADPSAIFASSTSGFRITDIARQSEHPERCIGAHPYNPPYLIPLVELTRGERTDGNVLQTAYDFYKAIGKEPIILQKEAVGFIANRLQVAIYREAVDLVRKGICTIEDVDKACVWGPGQRWAQMGPHLTFHIGSGPAGIEQGHKHFSPAFELWLSDMADWKTFPADWGATAQAGIEEEIAHRPPETGNRYEDIVEYRDGLLIDLLRLQKKL